MKGKKYKVMFGIIEKKFYCIINIVNESNHKQ